MFVSKIKKKLFKSISVLVGMSKCCANRKKQLSTDMRVVALLALTMNDLYALYISMHKMSAANTVYT